MRKQPKSFSVEVKRRPTSLSKKPVLVEVAAAAPAPSAAASIFARVEPAPAPEAQRRILPCLVTEAAIDAAKAVVDEDPAIAPRRRGRPPKQRAADDLAPLAPRKRGRPRKVAVEAQEQPGRAQTPSASTTPRPAPAIVAPVGASVRAKTRRAAVTELPRGERWKRRLPKALR